MRRRIGLLLALLLTLATTLMLHLPVRAAGMGVTVRSFTQEDLDGDGQPDRTTIRCVFAGKESTVVVYDRAGVMRRADRWEDAVNFQTMTWLFDYGNQDVYALALVFDQEGGHDVAYLYDDQDGDGRVKVSVNGKDVRVEETPFWTAKITSDSTWLLPDGTLNLNVRTLIDGRFEHPGFPEEYLKNMRTTGVPKWESGIVDSTHSGIPDYSYLLYLGPSPASSGLTRSGFNVNSGRHRSAQPEGYIFWPLLGGAEWYGRGNYFDAPYFLSFNWSRKKLAGTAVAGYPIEEGYHINSLAYVTREQTNYLNFENPMAYYDMAGDNDGLPELFIRQAYFGKDDILAMRHPQRTATNDILYTWNQHNRPDLFWDYKLGLAGRHEITTTERVGDFDLKTVPHRDMPRWVVDNPWDLVTFVAEEGGAYRSSEGIYEWGLLEGVGADVTGGPAGFLTETAARAYLTGESSQSISEYYRRIPKGFRGEYGEINDKVHLYFSPVDRRLHLLGAELGVWNLGDGVVIRLSNLGGSYLNRWIWQEDGEEKQSLSFIAPYLVFADGYQVRIQTLEVPPSVFAADPPTNQSEWRELGAQLAGQPAPLPGANFAGMFRQFPGPSLDLAGVNLLDVTPVDGGVRVVIDSAYARTAPWRDPQGEPLAQEIPAGITALTLRPGVPPVIEPSRLADIAITRVAAAGLVEELRPTRVEAELHNAGGVSELRRRVRFTATNPRGVIRAIGAATADVPAGGTVTVSSTWIPDAPGAWVIRAESDEAQLAAEIPASPLSRTGLDAIPSATNMSFSYNLGLAASLTLLALLALSLWRGVWSSFRARD